MSEVIDLADRRVGLRHNHSGQAVRMDGTPVYSMEHLSGLRPMKADRERAAMKPMPYYGPRRPDGGGDAA